MSNGQLSWLLVILAASATVSGNQLTLEGLHPVGLEFTDRPEHQVRRFVTDQLLASWEDLFAAAPPIESIPGS